MKNKIILKVVIAVLIASASTYLYIKSAEDKKRRLAPTQPFAITTLRESLEHKGVSLEGACANPASLTKDLIDLKDSDVKERFTFLCEDIEIAKKLEENFSTNSDYKYFLNCAKMHAANMQQITDDLKAFYPEDYKQLNFSKENQETILVKYLKHPKSAFLMAQCESKTEALYWRSVIDSGKVEDLKFCLKITEECISGQLKGVDCPANFQVYHDECTQKLNGMKH